MKFALSIWLYSWTMAFILSYVTDVKKVKVYSWVAVVVMGFEQLAITSQALRGELSHFHTATTYGFIVFQSMGIFILALIVCTAYIAYVFIRQKSYDLPPPIVLGIKMGLIFFVAFSLFGGYIGGLNGHTVGDADGGKGLWFLNWSRLFGDLRVAHFFGIHSLQIIPLFAILIFRISKSQVAINTVWAFSIIYLLFVLSVLIQFLMGLPFISV